MPCSMLEPCCWTLAVRQSDSDCPSDWKEPRPGTEEVAGEDPSSWICRFSSLPSQSSPPVFRAFGKAFRSGSREGPKHTDPEGRLRRNVEEGCAGSEPRPHLPCRCCCSHGLLEGAMAGSWLQVH